MNNENLKHGLGHGYQETGSLCYKAASISSYLCGEQIHPERSRQVCLVTSLSLSPHLLILLLFPLSLPFSLSLSKSGQLLSPSFL